MITARPLPLLFTLLGALSLGVAAPPALAASCTVSTARTTQCALTGAGDSATVTSTGSIAISATTGNASHAIHSNLSDTRVTLGGISIAGRVTTVGVGTNNGYIVNLVKTNAPVSSLPGGISITGSAVGNSRGLYLNDFDVAGITIGKGALLQSGSLAIHVVDSTVISGNVVNDGTITSNGGTIYLGNATVATRVTGAFTNRGTIFGPTYALVTESQVAGGATNALGARIIGQVSMANVSLTNNGEFANKLSSSVSNAANAGTPTLSAVKNYTQSADGLLRMAASGRTTAGTDFSRLNVNGDANVSGTLHVDVKPGFAATTGLVIPGVVVATGTLTGNFTAVTDNSDTYSFEAVVNGKAIDLVITVGTATDYAVNADAEPAEGGTVACTPNPVPSGGSSICTAAANSGFVFVEFSGDCTGSSPCTLASVTSTKSVTANFSPATFDIAAAADPEEGGTVTCTPNPVARGSSSTCTATANAGYTFTGFSDDCTGGSPCTLSNVMAAKTVTGNFTANTYLITATANPAAGGVVTCTPNPVSHGESSTCTARANAGYSFAAFSGACTGASPCTVSNVTSAASVTASFTLQSYSLGGTVSSLRAGSTLVLASGSGQTITVTGPATTFSFPTPLNFGQAYSVSVVTQPQDQVCDVTLGSGTIAGAVNNVAVRCLGTSGVYPTRGGPVRVSITGGTCPGFEEATVGFSDPVGAPKSAGEFPYGVLAFTVKSCGVGGTVRITMLLPQPLPPGARYWKQLPSGWVDWTDRVQMLGDRIILTLTDGQEGDTNPNPGEISDPSGPAAPAEAFNVPTLAHGVLGLLSLLIALVGFHAIRQSHSRPIA